MTIKYSDREVALTQKYDLFSIPEPSNISTFGNINGSYGGGVLAPNGKIYSFGIGSYLEIDPLVGSATTFPFISSATLDLSALGKNGKIYTGTSLSFGGSGSIQIDPLSKSTNFYSVNLIGSNLVTALNGIIYAPPISGSSNILYVNTVTGIGGFFGSGLDATNGGVLGSDGKIYCIPGYSGSGLTPLVIDPSTNTTSTPFNTVSGNYDSWQGGVLAQNGKIYGIPKSATSILKIDPATSGISTFGTVLGSAASGNPNIGGRSGGVLGVDGKIYAAPNGNGPFNLNAQKILVIDPITETLSYLDIPGYVSGNSQWRGGVLAPNGKIYFIPSDGCTKVLVIGQTTSTKPSNTLLGPYLNNY